MVNGTKAAPEHHPKTTPQQPKNMKQHNDDRKLLLQYLVALTDESDPTAKRWLLEKLATLAIQLAEQKDNPASFEDYRLAETYLKVLLQAQPEPVDASRYWMLLAKVQWQGLQKTESALRNTEASLRIAYAAFDRLSSAMNDCKKCRKQRLCNKHRDLGNVLVAQIDSAKSQKQQINLILRRQRTQINTQQTAIETTFDTTLTQHKKKNRRRRRQKPNLVTREPPSVLSGYTTEPSIVFVGPKDLPRNIQVRRPPSFQPPPLSPSRSLQNREQEEEEEESLQHDDDDDDDDEEENHAIPRIHHKDSNHHHHHHHHHHRSIPTDIPTNIVISDIPEVTSLSPSLASCRTPPKYQYRGRSQHPRTPKSTQTATTAETFATNSPDRHSFLLTDPLMQWTDSLVQQLPQLTKALTKGENVQEWTKRLCVACASEDLVSHAASPAKWSIEGRSTSRRKCV